jgi:outer membrane protein OmpA-like peptidoglycan-associated protein
VGGGGGSITLKDPNGTKIKYRYAQLGVGVGLGAKYLAAGALESDPSAGTVFMNDSFDGAELSSGDLTGVFVNREISGTVIGLGGGSVNVLDLGISTKNYLKNLAFGSVLNSAASLLMGGLMQGTGLSIGAMGYVGYLWEWDVLVGPIVLQDIAEIMAALSKEEPSTKVRITSQVEVDGPPITIPADILFDFDKYQIKPTAVKSLIEVGSKLRSYQGKHFLVQGFADGTGGQSRHNQTLSENRAATVKNWLISGGYVTASNISSRGYGIDYPVASNATFDGRAKNRRVEILVLKSPARL